MKTKTNICKHCGKTKSEHLGCFLWCCRKVSDRSIFTPQPRRTVRRKAYVMTDAMVSQSLAKKVREAKRKKPMVTLTLNRRNAFGLAEMAQITGRYALADQIYLQLAAIQKVGNHD